MSCVLTKNLKNKLTEIKYLFYERFEVQIFMIIEILTRNNELGSHKQFSICCDFKKKIEK